jgi:hypothetical protein
MRPDNLTFIKWQVAILAIVLIAAGLAGPAHCQTDGTVLLLQQTPPQGGTITPDEGVHRFEAGAEVTLTAVPSPGYQFIYWVGDVGAATANTTIVYLDTPKIIIAVFERAAFALPAVEGLVQSMPIGGLRRHAADYSRTAGGGGGRKRWRWPERPEEEEEEEEPEDFPVPPETEIEQELPVPTPEPATLVLLALGSVALIRKRGAKK